MRYFFVLTLSFLIFSGLASEQAQGGSEDKVYRFLNLPNSANVSALGGYNVSLQNRDVNMVFQNPALLSGGVHRDAAVNYTQYIGHIGYGSAVYAQDIDSLSHWAVSVNYISYGSFDGYTEEDIPTGDFSAGDFCLNAVYSRRLADRVMAGIALKPIYSHLETYYSFGLAVDVGANYYDPENDFSIGLVLKNIGVQFKGYYSEDGDQHREDLPWDIRLGVTKRLAHAPFRFSLSYINLNRWNLDYSNDKIEWGDMLFRHIIIGLEFIPANNFNIIAAYNHRRSKEFALGNTRSANGFSFGVNFHVSKFTLGAAYAQYAASGNTFSVSLGTNVAWK